MEATIVEFQSMGFVGKAGSGHQVVMDAKEEVGGGDGAPRPLELVLIGLGGCTGMDVSSILKKMRIDYDRFEIAASAERAEEHPKTFTKIHMTYRFKGNDLDESKLKRAIELSQDRYCSVSAMLKQAAEITWSLEVTD
ncbi:OsmC family protein [candidate division KSB1 bacterium]